MHITENKVILSHISRFILYHKEKTHQAYLNYYVSYTEDILNHQRYDELK